MSKYEKDRYFVVCKCSSYNINNIHNINNFIETLYNKLLDENKLQRYKIIVVLNLYMDEINELTDYIINKYNNIYIQKINIYYKMNFSDMVYSNINTFMIQNKELITFFDIDDYNNSFLSLQEKDSNRIYGKTWNTEYINTFFIIKKSNNKYLTNFIQYLNTILFSSINI